MPVVHGPLSLVATVFDWDLWVLHGEHDRLLLAVTSHRLLVLVREAPLAGEPEELSAQSPRGTFGERRDPLPAGRRPRVALAFQDGSWVGLVAESEREAEALAAAWG